MSQAVVRQRKVVCASREVTPQSQVLARRVVCRVSGVQSVSFRLNRSAESVENICGESLRASEGS